ncbi:galactosyltransferase-related protein [Solidesulfovibrio sp.]|uniref:galactosyltransferase-related protein n=1 Tax=Solidesulfovibrio sp. TaxID=2910990 RepID=UPI002624CDBB|nr:galactosyltransferase-related protein [Solidesulfovibrio sp.]
MHAKIDLTQATVLVTLKFDSVERVRNLMVVLRFLERHVATRALLHETGDAPRFQAHLGALPACASYAFVPDDSPFFHRTRLLNRMLRQVATPLVVVYDVDAICHPAQLRRARDAVLGGADVAFPHDGRCLDVPEALIPRLLGPPAGFPGPGECRTLYPDATGGVVFFRKASLVAAGLYNERFRSWGHEDRELLHRMTTLGYAVARIPGCVLHMRHPRHADSHPEKNPHYAANTAEYERVKAMDETELRAVVAGFPWLREEAVMEGDAGGGQRP